ncbi:GspE/PulE family protein [Parachitinimonas caeni]|uniref:GspE/PulE family protein n=1 Tax=Parachitinimonas caeni TaxID=3031301 RepID=A0ABT7DS45_9NEIS|nr:GspE/PulE family protein [Parachitinimonas caeni]MDK2122876.1 GspE/PulE family protein [Parachitinimonas caeni]
MLTTDFSVQAQAMGLAVLAESDLPDEIIPLQGVTEGFLRDNGILPLGFDGETLRVVSVLPMPIMALEGLKQFASQAQLHVSLAPRDVIEQGIDLAYKKGAMPGGIGLADSYGDAAGLDEDDLEALKHQAEDAPVVRLAQYVIQTAVEGNASDIHLEVYQEAFKVRLRIDGVLHDMESPPKRMFLPTISHLKLRARMNIAERRLPQDGRIKMTIKDRDVDMRVSTLPTVYGESMVIRILDKQESTMHLDALGFEPATLTAFRKAISQPHGMILVTGPTGSGKTTTLYAALGEINTPDVKIITVEDPVEYQMEGINQVQVKAQINLTFANALRSIVRQDPDIIMVGEIRDGETADIAIQSALTGHLVFSTIHTNDSFSAPHRLLDMGVESYLIASSVIMVLAQRLVRVICPHCRVETPVSAADAEFLRQEGFDPAEVSHLYRGVGCQHCANTGYSGRKSIYELLPITDAVKAAILKKLPAVEIKQIAQRDGVRTMRQAGIHKALAGVTTLEELGRVTRED